MQRHRAAFGEPRRAGAVEVLGVERQRGAARVGQVEHDQIETLARVSHEREAVLDPQREPRVVEAALHYGARGRWLFARVLFPGALPFIFTGLRLGLGYALIVAIAVEIVAASHGLGALLWLSWQVLKVEDMYATFLVIAVLGAFLSYGLAALRRQLLPWVQDVAER